METFPVAVFTAWQPSAVRAQMSENVFKARIMCAQEFLRSVRSVTPHVVVVTDSLSEPLARQTGVQTMQMENQNTGATRRAALSAALALVPEEGPSALVWSEPEKIEIGKFLKIITQPVLEGAADLIIPRRADMASYPSWQVSWEATGNAMCSTVLGQEFDYFFGPRVLNKRAASYFLNYPGTQQVSDAWDCVYSPLVDCKYAGLKFGEVVIDFSYPSVQRDAEREDMSMLPRRTKTLDLIVRELVQRKLFLEQHTHGESIAR